MISIQILRNIQTGAEKRYFEEIEGKDKVLIVWRNLTSINLVGYITKEIFFLI
jgi:hypothetical protein